MFRKKMSPLALLLLGGILPLPACSRGEAAVYRRGEPFSLGSATVAVQRVESVSASYMANMGRSAPDDVQFLAVFLQVQGPTAAEPGKRILTMTDKMVLNMMLRLAVEDAAGNRYTHPTPLSASQYNLMMAGAGGAMSPEDFLAYSESSGSGPPRDWVAIFAVPREARGLKLLIKNLRRVGDQPRLVAVDLGR